MELGSQAAAAVEAPFKIFRAHMYAAKTDSAQVTTHILEGHLPQRLSRQRVLAKQLALQFDHGPLRHTQAAFLYNFLPSTLCRVLYSGCCFLRRCIDFHWDNHPQVRKCWETSVSASSTPTCSRPRAPAVSLKFKKSNASIPSIPNCFGHLSASGMKTLGFETRTAGQFRPPPLAQKCGSIRYLGLGWTTTLAPAAVL